MLKKTIKLIYNKILSARKNIELISSGSQISPETILNAGQGCKFIKNIICTSKVNLGRHVAINGPNTRISAKINTIEIKDFSSIASNTIIQEYYHKYNRISSYYMNQNIFNESSYKDIYSKGSIVIDEDVWIGSNCVILSGVTIGRGSIIGAGSVVTKNIPPYSVYAGNPAKKIKNRFSSETINLLEEIQWWNWNIEKILRNKEIFNYSEDQLLNNKNKILSLRNE